jgi:hypothetical protein
MARITVLIPDGDTSREVIFEAARYAQRTTAPPDGAPVPPSLELYAGQKVIASFPFGAWMGVWYTARKKAEPNGRF